MGCFNINYLPNTHWFNCCIHCRRPTCLKIQIFFCSFRKFLYQMLCTKFKFVKKNQEFFYRQFIAMKKVLGNFLFWTDYYLFNQLLKCASNKSWKAPKNNCSNPKIEIILLTLACCKLWNKDFNQKVVLFLV